MIYGASNMSKRRLAGVRRLSQSEEVIRCNTGDCKISGVQAGSTRRNVSKNYS